MKTEFKDTEHIAEVIQLQANLDDMNAEHYPYVIDQLLAAGARDAFLIPIIMKKGRPGIQINVLLDATLLERIEKIIFQETTTIGVRYFKGHCHRLKRTFKSITTPWGNISVKIGWLQDEIVNIKPEFQECQMLAEANNISLKTIMTAVNLQISQLRKSWEKSE